MPTKTYMTPSTANSHPSTALSGFSMPTKTYITPSMEQNFSDRTNERQTTHPDGVENWIADMGSPYPQLGTPVLEPIECDVCGQVFKGVYQRGNLRRHKRSQHPSPEEILSLTCNLCNKEYKRNDALKKHQRKIHAIGGRPKRRVRRIVESTPFADTGNVNPG